MQKRNAIRASVARRARKVAKRGGDGFAVLVAFEKRSRVESLATLLVFKATVR